MRLRTSPLDRAKWERLGRLGRKTGEGTVTMKCAGEVAQGAPPQKKSIGAQGCVSETLWPPWGRVPSIIQIRT